MCSNEKCFEKSPRRICVVKMLLAVPLMAYLQVCSAQPSSQTTFPSAEEASHALFVAVKTQDTRALMQILGQRNELISSNDAVQDKFEREQFVHKFQEMHRLVRMRKGEMVLHIGAENWPFPIPLVSRNGAWRYDSDAGEKEVLYRWIGENEITAIEVCQALVATVKKPQPHADADNPVGVLLATTRADNKPVSFQGYNFRILPSSGNNTLALVAYPVAYGHSGVMTFIVDDRGVVYQKDLGPGTTKAATAIAVYHTDSTWTPTD